MNVETIEQPDDIHSLSTESQVTDDPALKDSQSGRSTGDGSSSSGSSTEESKFVKKETRHVFMLRVIVLLLLFCTSAAISLVVFFITSAGEEDEFNSQYYAAADKVTGTSQTAALVGVTCLTYIHIFILTPRTLSLPVLQTVSFHEIATHKLEAAGSLVVAMIAHGEDHKLGWPFVTLSSFQERAHTVKDLSGVLYLGFNPVVSREQRLAWENYTNYHPDANWYQEGREYQKVIGIDDLDNRPQVKTNDPQLDLSTGVANYIYDFERGTADKGIISPEADFYLPIWQVRIISYAFLASRSGLLYRRAIRAFLTFFRFALTNSPILPFPSLLFVVVVYCRRPRSHSDPWSTRIALVTQIVLWTVSSIKRSSLKAWSTRLQDMVPTTTRLPLRSRGCCVWPRRSAPSMKEISSRQSSSPSTIALMSRRASPLLLCALSFIGVATFTICKFMSLADKNCLV